jgi:hypothetical protein
MAMKDENQSLVKSMTTYIIIGVSSVIFIALLIWGIIIFMRHSKG